jgi:catechol 2,3-dioxygenase-like lactoylglutathione lyase family enzyme
MSEMAIFRQLRWGLTGCSHGDAKIFCLPAVRKNVMKIVPVIKSSDLQRSLHFYTQILDFERKWPAGHEDYEMANGVIDLVLDGADLQLSRHSGDGVFGSVNRVFVDDVDERYATFRRRGLDTTQRPESPIHTAPVDQTWGLREFAVADPDGNNLCFCTPNDSLGWAQKRSPPSRG